VYKGTVYFGITRIFEHYKALKMRLFGYARVSSSQQSLETQKQAIKTKGVRESRIFFDKATGSSSANKVGINSLLARVKDGDVILVTRLDRLGKDTIDMINLINKFNALNVGIRFLENSISTEGATGKMVITILAAVAEAEKSRLVERTSEGRVEARFKGIAFGRKRFINRDILLGLKLSGHGATTIAREMNISRAAIYKILKEENVTPL
jgi:DNA invertase Pin-like site-specific DNA recombinase